MFWQMELDRVSQLRASSVRIGWRILEFMDLSKSFCPKKTLQYIETPPLQSIQSSTDPKVSMVPLDYYTSRSKEYARLCFSKGALDFGLPVITSFSLR